MFMEGINLFTEEYRRITRPIYRRVVYRSVKDNLPYAVTAQLMMMEMLMTMAPIGSAYFHTL